MKKLLIIGLTLLLCGPVWSQKKSKVAAAAPQRQAKNVILLIGDGMGLTQISAGMYFNNNQSQFERFPVAGLHKAYSSNDLITDSGAGATAFASGTKTYNGAIGVDPDSMPVKTILEEAEEKGLATGMVVTSTLTHATPASFIAHVRNRKFDEEIATFFLKTEVDFLAGGGKKFFDQRAADGRNLVKELQAKGYQINDFSQNAESATPPDPSKNFIYFSADGDPAKASEGRTYLAPYSVAAAKHLKQRSEKGFFLMIEGSQIDWGGHANNSDYIVSEVVDFDQTIGKILDFAAADGETLVIVTADHETGGYAINPGSELGKIRGAFTTNQHTAQLVPVFAFGPGAELFSGIYENTAIYEKMKAVLGW
ncbi:MAG: alkaline phosphatase [Haliscomenobacter sp.]|uniref:alkaline phosphatase n=1 Tax=Haliscomenobacter sp. TaxID=2717303 RepID=UPI00299FF178|nr:alkaline phosphatase [Haliscomenobacter sp.]MDX2072406.1 alkaline phosphatase [Haliscomenobacter sp.]